jgi:hypothetical protein
VIIGSRMLYAALASAATWSVLTCAELGAGPAADVSAAGAEPGAVAAGSALEPTFLDDDTGGAVCVTPDGAPYESETC